MAAIYCPQTVLVSCSAVISPFLHFNIFDILQNTSAVLLNSSVYCVIDLCSHSKTITKLYSVFVAYGGVKLLLMSFGNLPNIL